jgi:hypothetical protein
MDEKVISALFCGALYMLRRIIIFRYLWNKRVEISQTVSCFAPMYARYSEFALKANPSI